VFEAKLQSGKTVEIIVKVSEYKGTVGVDVRKYEHGEPTKKGTFLVIANGQAEFVSKALPQVLAAKGGEPKVLESTDRMQVVVARFDYKEMEGYSIRKEAKGGNWGKGIWLNPTQATWAAMQIAAALADA
jgi:hypothetical protein